MDKKSRQKIFSKRDVIKYSVNRAYFGKLTGAGLADAYHMFKHTEDWDKPVVNMDVTVGKIDGNVICRALWYEMSYNPARFGRVSPFVYKGREDIYHFCREGVPENFPGFTVIDKIHHKMIDFMMLNGRKIGKWYDVIYTQNGVVTIKLVNGHSDDNYKVLSMLRDMIKIVVAQNMEDFKHKEYRTQMLTVINKRHPNGVRGDNCALLEQKPAKTLFTKTDEEIAEQRRQERLDDAEENTRITAENRKYFSYSQSRQARQDLATIRTDKTR